MGPLQIGVVEAFDVPRLAVEAQFLLQGIHQPLGISFGILDFQVLELLGAIDTGALLREFEQFELFAALGHREGHTVEQQRRRRQERYDDLTGQRPGNMLDDMLDGQRQHVAFVAPDTRLEFHGINAHDRPVADTHEIAIGHIVVRKQRKNIHVDDLRTDDHRLARIVVQRIEALLVALRQFEFQFPGSALHLLFEVATHGAQVALEHRDDHVDEPAVFPFALRPDAGAFAVAQVVLQADRIFPLGDLLGGEVELAGTQGNHLADEIQHAVLHHHRSVGAEVLRPVAVQLPRRLHAREMLAAHHDPGIGLIVFEQDIVPRLEGLDERVFQQQGVGFAVHDDMADLGDLLHQHANLGAVLLALHEIG